MYTINRYRIKDSSCKGYLKSMAESVNFVWNYCNEANKDSWDKFGKYLSKYDLQTLTKGCSKELNLLAQTVNMVCHEYALKAKQNRKQTQKWRSSKKNLGWIPYCYQGLKIEKDQFYFNGIYYRFWNSKPINGEVKSGCISEDSKGRWYINVTIKKELEPRKPTYKEVGLDLGLKTIVTLSDGVAISRENLTNKFAERLRKIQRAKKKRQFKTLHAKIKNKRIDWNKKTAKYLCDNYDFIAVGDVSSTKIIKNKMASKVYDASWHGLKSTLVTTAIRRGVEVHVVDEKWSTVTCSACGRKTGPSGLSALGVREWTCIDCKTSHNRDVNAAMNILSRCRTLHPILESKAKAEEDVNPGLY